ncbi:hypothetical protein NDU88_006665 [Pleurodeles waltl]|uniref:Uncharacterized protein n=1 Tax=Pleurodeles waltl TaxID=8319 RepID=A0AAV7VQD5_PLEWA|nr:hypothetical protein NDU88_006665 [Pleurodeles waltl]
MDKSGTDSCAVLFGRAAFQEVLSVMALSLRDLPFGCGLVSVPPGEGLRQMFFFSAVKYLAPRASASPMRLLLLTGGLPASALVRAAPWSRPEAALERATLERAAVRGLRSLTPPPGVKYCGVREPMSTVPTKCQHWCVCVVQTPSLDPDAAGVPAFAVDAGV